MGIFLTAGHQGGKRIEPSTDVCMPSLRGGAMYSAPRLRRTHLTIRAKIAVLLGAERRENHLVHADVLPVRRRVLHQQRFRRTRLLSPATPLIVGTRSGKKRRKGNANAKQRDATAELVVRQKRRTRRRVHCCWLFSHFTSSPETKWCGHRRKGFHDSGVENHVRKKRNKIIHEIA